MCFVRGTLGVQPSYVCAPGSRGEIGGVAQGFESVH